MRFWGFGDATVTSTGPDGGIDVEASEAVAQVKFTAHAVGGPAVQQLFGARGPDAHKAMLFFCGTSYSVQARAYADRVGMALFTYDLLGQPAAANGAARALVEAAEEARDATPAVSPRPSSPAPPTSRRRDASAADVPAVAPTPLANAVAAAALWMLPATLLLVGVAAALARGALSTMIVILSLIGLAAYVSATTAARRALANVTAPSGRVLGAGLMVAPGLLIWLPVTVHTYTDADHSSGVGAWFVLALLALVGPAAAARPQA